jgi:hypothetical protein
MRWHFPVHGGTLIGNRDLRSTQDQLLLMAKAVAMSDFKCLYLVTYLCDKQARHLRIDSPGGADGYFGSH